MFCRPFPFAFPRIPQEMGPEPAAGKLLGYRLCQQARGGLRRRHAGPEDRPIYADLAGKRRLPQRRPREPYQVSRGGPRQENDQRYSARDRKLVVFAVPEEYFALPDDTWKIGDEVRYYYKDPARALRLMNVSKTDVNKGGK